MPSASCILMSHLPGYCLLPVKELKDRASAALSRIACCDICPRCCAVDRLSDQRGFCRTGRLAGVASYTPHFGEEDCLVGSAGSGTIFFSGCFLFCCRSFLLGRGLLLSWSFLLGFCWSGCCFLSKIICSRYYFGRDFWGLGLFSL